MNNAPLTRTAARPSVRTYAQQPMTLMIGRRMAFTMPKIAATMTTVSACWPAEPPSVMPWKMSVAIHSASALTASRMRRPMTVIVPWTGKPPPARIGPTARFRSAGTSVVAAARHRA